MNDRIDISRPDLGDEEYQALREVIDSGWLTQGPKVAAFEKAFAKRHQVKHAIAVSSCTTGLFLALQAIGVRTGDEVIVPAFTWVATANVVLHCGATPIFVDVDPRTYNLDPELLHKVITTKTKAIIPVHLFGRCADMDKIEEIAGEIPLIEDAACASGAEYKNRSAGSIGLCGVFSFHPRKVITTGEGGMITTNDDAFAERLDSLRNHGASISEEQRHMGSQPHILPNFKIPGFNCRMTDLQGAVGLAQLAKLDKFTKERQQWAKFYSSNLAMVEWLHMPTVPDSYRHAWQAYVCYVVEEMAPKSRNEIMEYLFTKKISTRPGTHAVHMLDIYRDKYGLHHDDFPGARDCDLYSIAIPLHNKMTQSDYEYIVETIKSI